MQLYIEEMARKRKKDIGTNHYQRIQLVLPSQQGSLYKNWVKHKLGFTYHKYYV